MKTNSMIIHRGALIALAIGTLSVWAQGAVSQTPPTEARQKLESRYADQLARLRAELTPKIPQNDQAKGDSLNEFLVSDALDAKFAKYVVPLEATPQGLAAFTRHGIEQTTLVD